MALKQAIRANKIKNYRKELEPLTKRRDEIDETVMAAVEELESREFTDEELNDAEEAQKALEEELQELKARIDELEGLIAGLEEENQAEAEEVEEAVKEEPERGVLN